jgi:DNA-binding beta-propeller fold protein YncE
MNPVIPSSRSLSYRAVFILLLLVTACGPEIRRNEPGNLYWPSPPEPPRIHYIQSIYSEDDIGRVYSIKEKLFGKDYIDSITRPYGVYARRGKLYVTDLVMKSVVVFDFAEKRLSSIGAGGAFQNPSSVVSDAAGNLYVSDAGQGKITVFDARGSSRVVLPLVGSKPVALAINEALGRLYVVDRNNHEVLVLGLNGKKLFKFGGFGDADGKFNLPLSIVLDRAGTVYVLDGGNFRVQIFDAEGKFISKFGTVGDHQGTFANPKGIAVDSEGHIYVTDAAFSNFQIFDQQGNALLFVGGLGPNPGYFHLPGGITIDENDRIYVADQFNKRVQVFQYLPAP